MIRHYDPQFPISEVMSRLREASQQWNVPVVTLVALQDKDPFKVLLSTIISLRTKDEVTIDASKRLYQLLSKPSDVYQVSEDDIAEAIYPAGFYKTKAPRIWNICDRLVREFNGIVPQDIETLLTFDGVGRKTANLVISEGYGLPAMCIDTHCHRIPNRWGYISTKDAYETEMLLREILPVRYWNEFNALLVAFGQSVCRPVSPLCSQCPIAEFCKRKGVKNSR